MRTYLACLSVLVVACGPTFVEPCPEGWTSESSGAYCKPPSATVDAFHAQLGTGVFGFVRETHDVSNHITSELMAGEQVQLVSASTPAPTTKCTLSPNPIASTLTDAQGVFALAAPPGSYRLESCTMVVPVTIPSGVIEQDLDLNDVPQ